MIIIHFNDDNRIGLLYFALFRVKPLGRFQEFAVHQRDKLRLVLFRSVDVPWEEYILRQLWLRWLLYLVSEAKMSDGESENVRVAVRVRPFISFEHIETIFFIGKKFNCVTQRVCAGNMFDTALMLNCKYRTVQFFTTLHGYLFLYQCEIRLTLSRFYEKSEVQSKI